MRAVGPARFTCLAWVIAAGFIPSWKGGGGWGWGWRGRSVVKPGDGRTILQAVPGYCQPWLPHPQAHACPTPPCSILALSSIDHDKTRLVWRQPPLWATGEGMGPSGRWELQGIQLQNWPPYPCMSLNHGQRYLSRKKGQWFSVASA